MGTINKINKIIFFIALFLLSFMFSITKNTADLDLWHRMAVGKIFSQLGNVVYHDIFTYFPSKPMWVDHEWLSGVIFYNLGIFFGDYGILFLKVLILFSILVLIYKTNQLIYPEPDKQRISWYFVTLVGVLLGIAATLRCQVFTYLFFTLWIYVLERVRRGENRLIWIFPVTTIIWANMHAGFFAGFGLLIFYAAGELLNRKNPWKYIGILALCLPVTLINPYGIEYWHYLKEAITMPRPFITEWESLKPFESFYKVIGTKMQLVLLIPALIYQLIINFCLYLMAWKDSKWQSQGRLKKIGSTFMKFFRSVDWVEIIALSVTLYLGIKHLRHIVFFSIVAGIFGYKYFVIFADAIFSKIKDKIYSLIPEGKHDVVCFAKFALTYSFIINVCLIMITGTSHAINLSFYPTKAVEFIKLNKLEGNLLVPFNWGSYAMWKLYPQNLISIDGRYEETYKNEAYMDVSTITFYNKKCDRTKWKETFYKYHHDILLINKENEVHKDFRKLKEWKPIYEDKKAVVFVPSSTLARKWLQPNKDEKYYIKTKYENNINF